MKARPMLVLTVLVSLLILGVIAIRASTTNAVKIPGIYTLIQINERPLPAVSWTRKTDDKNCKTETLAGALLLSSEGRWAALVTERDICTSKDGSQDVSPDRSGLFVVSYKVHDNKIELKDETLGGIDTGWMDGDTITVEVIGTGPFAGQTARYLVRKVRLK